MGCGCVWEIARFHHKRRTKTWPRHGAPGSFFIILIMNNLLIGVIIGVLLAVVVFSVLTESCPRVGEIITAWDELAKETHLPPVGRGPVPRHASVLTANVRGL